MGFTHLQIEQNPWLGGYRPPDSRSFCPLSSTDFVGHPPPPEQISWVRHWRLPHFPKHRTYSVVENVAYNSPGSCGFNV
jgi:hypothetical protein